MNVSLTDLSHDTAYKLLAGLVIPRPIAWISSWSDDGIANCAPFSFFNLVSADPPMCAIGINARASGKIKDTVVNIRRSGEFVLNLVDEQNAKAMRITGDDTPRDISEFQRAGLTPVPSVKVGQPRIQEAAASFECVVHQLIAINERQELVLGRIVHLHTRDGIVDEKTMRISEQAYSPVGRLYGNQYCTTKDRFELLGGPM